MVTITQSDIEFQQLSQPTQKLRSTTHWVNIPYAKRNLWQKIATLDLGSKKCYTVQPRNPNPPPRLNIWKERLWLTKVIAPPLIIQALWYFIVPETNFFHTWHPLVAFIFYHISFVAIIIQTVQYIHRGTKKYGTFDEHNRPRDVIADKDVSRSIVSVLVYTLARTGGGLVLGGYDRHSPPSLGRTISWLFPMKIALWLVVLDFFFYCYHRTVHTVPSLWKYHSKHHSTKHPSPLQSILAGSVQEIIEIFLVPLAASLVMPLTAHEFWIGQCVLMFVEALGHSGMRVYWTHPMCGELLQPFGMDLTIEDHDMHHRNGKNGQNYGKQTRIFDRLFNTIDERVEGTEYNLTKK